MPKNESGDKPQHQNRAGYGIADCVFFVQGLFCEIKVADGFPALLPADGVGNRRDVPQLGQGLSQRLLLVHAVPCEIAYALQ